MRTHDIDARQPWFRAKRFGWGWTPQTWQGWLVIGVYALLTVGGVPLLLVPAQAGRVATGLYVLLLTATLIVICYRTGEPLRWRWGDK